MKILEDLKKSYSSRLFLEANTPVTEVQYTTSEDQSHPYSLQTPRGIVQARHVVYCTNGYSGHLLPQLRGRLFPKRGTMTVQDLGKRVPNQGAKNTWNFHEKPRYDEEIESVVSGYYYLQQNARSGYFFLGGDAQTPFTALTSNDSNVSSVGVQHLQDVLPTFFGLNSDSSDKLISSWSGIMGYTADSLPLVGNIPRSVTSREGDGEWIAAGFNGMGMTLCWRAGETLAGMINGQDVSESLPAAFGISDGRMKQTLTVERSIEHMGYLLIRDGDSM
jgi:glycine/D-amino acid oxidase-like deaminating enzyme